MHKASNFEKYLIERCLTIRFNTIAQQIQCVSQNSHPPGKIDGHYLMNWNEKEQ